MSEEERKCWTVSTTAWRPDRASPAMTAVHFQSPPKKTERGTSFGLRFPVLIVPDLVEGKQEFAEKVAALLNEHWPTGEAA